MEPSDNICVYCSCPTSSRCRRKNSVVLSALHAILRYACSDQGVVGSMYDACTDSLLSPLKVTHNLLIHTGVREKPACQLIKGDDSNEINLLRAINIDGDLRVSIALNINQITDGTLLLNTLHSLPTRTIRCIDYYHVNQKVSLSTDMQVARSTVPSSLPAVTGTHIITSLERGMEFILVLEFARNEHLSEIDAALEQICAYFKDPKTNALPTIDQEKLHDLTITIFTRSAHLHSLMEQENFSDICLSIAQHIHDDRESATLSYTLHPVKCIYFDGLHAERAFHQLDAWVIHEIEQKILPLSDKLRRMHHVFVHDVSPQLSEKLRSFMEKTHDALQRIDGMSKTVRSNLASIVTDYRRGKLDVPRLKDELNNVLMQNLNCELENLASTVSKLQRKERLIAQLQTDHHIEYFNVADLENSNDNLESLKGKLCSLDQQNCYLCSSTELIEKDREHHERLCQDLIQRCSNNPSFRPVFADFSYCSQPLSDMQVFQPSTPRTKELNVLLVGETGVGKTTFINAFVNYLVYPSLSEAENGEPVVLIPTSFVVTLGDQFEEKMIAVGELDPNEDHNHPDQSVTQDCRSYLFRIDNDVRLRIIDTPGIGDTRGIEQDSRNIEHIVSYISQLSHLNAVCFLMKPNTARLDALFRLCFTQLFEFLAPNVRENIIFCFTNTRATFYAPGDTLPSLKALINQLPDDRRPALSKGNTFCFDSESFRYLAVVKAGVKSFVDDDQRLDFANSWKVSMNESIRLLAYIEHRPRYDMIEYRSLRHAQIMIKCLARPIVEAVRNALMNLLISDQRRIIEIDVRPKLQPTDSGTSTVPTMLEIGDFCIIDHSLNQHRTLNDGLPVCYELQCSLNDRKDIRFISQTESMKDRLLSATLTMTGFLLQTDYSHSNLFLPWFDSLLQEEDAILAQRPSSMANEKLHHNLHQIKARYEKNIKDHQSTQPGVSLNAIYQCIEEVLSYPLVSKQLDAIRQSQMAMMKHHERDVSSQYPHISANRLMTLSTMTDPPN